MQSASATPVINIPTMDKAENFSNFTLQCSKRQWPVLGSTDVFSNSEVKPGLNFHTCAAPITTSVPRDQSCSKFTPRTNEKLINGICTIWKLGNVEKGADVFAEPLQCGATALQVKSPDASKTLNTFCHPLYNLCYTVSKYNCFQLQSLCTHRIHTSISSH